MAGRKIELGPTGDLVRQRIKEIREARGLSYAELSRRLAAAGRPIPALGLRRIEAGERRVDVDDLIALAWVLEASPTMFLVPKTIGHTVPVTHTAVGTHPSRRVNSWIRGMTWFTGDPDDDEEARKRRSEIRHETPR